MKPYEALLVACLVVAVHAQVPPLVEECVSGKYPPQDNSTVKTYVINLDLPPEQRWNQLGKEKSKQIHGLIGTFRDFIAQWSPKASKEMLKLIDEHMDKLAYTMPDPFDRELKGLATASGLPLGEVVMYNIFYELFSMCTSIVAADSNGKMYHARNLDFGLMMGWEPAKHSWMITDALRPLIVNLEFQRQGKTLFKSVSFAGYVGILTAVKPGVFTLSMNERFALNGGYLGILEWIFGKRDDQWMSFLTREVMENATSYEMAQTKLIKTGILSPAYFILGGTTDKQMSIITRGRQKALDVWNIGEKNSTWYLLETNYDNWKAPLIIDNRRGPAHKCMDKMTQKNVGFAGIYDVLSSRPVLNKLTTYTALMQVDSGDLETYLRHCPDPCPPF